MIKITGWKSKALWSKIGLSEDNHSERAQALNVSHILKRDYSIKPCDIRGLCLESWVEPILSGESAPKTEDQRTANNSAMDAIALLKRWVEFHHVDSHSRDLFLATVKYVQKHQ